MKYTKGAAWLPATILLMVASSLPAQPGIHSEPYELLPAQERSARIQVSATASTARDRHKTLFDNPAERMRQIKQLFADAGRQILEIKQMIDKDIARIAANEQQILTGKTDAAAAGRLTAENIRLFRRIEEARVRIVEIQLHTAQNYLGIEQQAYNRITGDAGKKLHLLKQDPAAYWLSRRTQLFSAGELNDLLPEDRIRLLYR